MSDGPHKSLPMLRHWKKLAERAAKEAYSAGEVLEALAPALKRDFRDVPIDALRAVFNNDDQPSLLGYGRNDQLEAIRCTCRGSAAAHALVDSAIDVATRGITGDVALRMALENALRSHQRSGFRSIEEHYLRKSGKRSSIHIRHRLSAAGSECDLRNLSQELLSGGRRVRIGRLPRHAGIEDGPPL